MDVIKAVKLYIEKMTSESGPGMKILLMDKDTVRIYYYFDHKCHLPRTILSYFKNILFHFSKYRRVLYRWHSVNRICYKKKCIYSNELTQQNRTSE